MRSPESLRGRVPTTGSKQSPWDRSTLRELEAFSGAWLPGFLSLFHARIATQQTLGLERAAQICIDLKQSACDAELRGTGLSNGTTATRVNGKVVAVNCLGSLKRLQHDVLQRCRWEIIFEASAVDIDFATAGRHPDACDRCFPAAGGDEFLGLWHRVSLLQFDSFGLLRRMRMRVAAIDL